MSISLFIFVFSACSLDNDDPIGGNTHTSINPSLYPMFFKENSQWIYLNSVSEEWDSIQVLSRTMDTIGPFTSSSGFTTTEEVIDYAFSSSKQGEYDERYMGFLISRSSASGGNVYISSFHVGDATSNSYIKAIHPQMQIGDFSFDNVVEMDIIADSYISEDMNLYYVDSIGVVRKEIRVNNEITETWDLVQYSVEIGLDD